MKATLPLLLFFVGSVFAEEDVRPCSFNTCPNGYNRRYVGNTGKELECICERKTISSCDKAKDECRYYNTPSCATAEKVCEPESMLDLCDVEYLFPDACDRAAEKIRKREEAKDKKKNPQRCSELKKRCLDGDKYACYEIPEPCDTNTIVQLCELEKVASLEQCATAKREKRKLEEEKSKYSCDKAVAMCSDYPKYIYCPRIPQYCGIESIAKACYKNIFKNTTVCDDAIKRSQYLTLREIDEDKCMTLTEQCNTGKVDACAQIPPVCGAPVVAAMCRKSYTIKKTLNLKLMCKGVDIKGYNPGCSELKYNCENYHSGCELAGRFCSLKTRSYLCNKNLLDRNSEECLYAFSSFPPGGKKKN